MKKRELLERIQELENRVGALEAQREPVDLFITALEKAGLKVNMKPKPDEDAGPVGAPA